MYNINVIIMFFWSVIQIIRKMPLGVKWKSIPFYNKTPGFLAYLFIISLHLSVNFSSYPFIWSFRIKILLIFLPLRPTNASEPNMPSFLIQSATNSDCDSLTYGIISISVTIYNPVNIFLPSVSISVFPLDYGTSTNFVTKDTFIVGTSWRL
jgi:hypothetical protein